MSLAPTVAYEGGKAVRIVQMSDIHLGSRMHKPEMLEAVMEETNALSPDLVAIAGDLTETGHRWEFEEAKSYLDRLECPNVMTVMGNKDAKNVGRRHFKDLFGPRERAATLSVREGEAKVVALDSTRMDLDVGEVELESCSWLDSEFRGWDRGPKTGDVVSRQPPGPDHRATLEAGLSVGGSRILLW